MNYYTLPKINNKIIVDPHVNTDNIKPYISQTLILYYNKIIEEIQQLEQTNIEHEKQNELYNEIFKIVNPYQYIFSKVPGSKFSVSKIKTKSIMFYDLYEIFQTINLLDSFKFDIMNSLIVGENYEDSLECLEMLRENYNIDKFFCFNEYNTKLHNCIENTKFNFIIYELNNYNNINQYIINLVELLIIIFNQLKENSIVIIKINNLFYKPILEIVYLLNSLFEKTFIIKPNTSDATSFDKYIVLQKLKLNHYDYDLFYNYNTILTNFVKKYSVNMNLNANVSDNHNSAHNSPHNSNHNSELNIQNIINFELPYFFLNKIDDINIIIGQQQLEALNQIINIWKSKNIEEKIEIMKKNNIQKSVNWCEKFKIPCNKFSEKINIFL